MIILKRICISDFKNSQNPLNQPIWLISDLPNGNNKKKKKKKSFGVCKISGLHLITQREYGLKTQKPKSN